MMADTLLNADGIDIDFSKVLHGEQAIELHRPMPKSATLVHQATIPAIYDKGKAAIIILKVETTEEGGDPICTNTFTVFARGAGGFGGERGPGPTNVTPDLIKPDMIFESVSSVRQPLLYRLTGDMNPLHADPAVAKKAGFPKPILQGLSTFGMACKAVIDNVLGGDVQRVTGFGTRFSGIFFPGETLVTKVWKQDGKLLIASHSKERNSFVLENGWMTYQ
jgi:acyl dehydratase